MTTISWAGTATALSSISHSSGTRGLTTMLRRETIITADGQLLPIPLISGNALRGKLRRVAEHLLGETIDYRGRLSIAAAAALRSGGALTKATTDPISGQALARLRELIPLIGVFGTAGAGRLIDGCLQVGKLLPLTNETAHLTTTATGLVSLRDITGIETYSHTDDQHHHANHSTDPPDDGPNSTLQFRLETFRAGTRFDVWLNLTRPTPLEAAFFHDVLARYATAPMIAGRSAIGHGRLALDLTCTHTITPLDWAATATAHLDEAIDLLNRL